jgi:hypothetical protein
MLLYLRYSELAAEAVYVGCFFSRIRQSFLPGFPMGEKIRMKDGNWNFRKKEEHN